MSVQGLTISLTTAALAVAGDATIHGVIRVCVRNKGTGTAYLGSSGVTTSGYALTSADAPLCLTIQNSETLYGTSTGASVLDVLRMNETT
jgi:hypothetical protein